MLLPRFFARLDIKGPNVVKGIRMEGLRVVGKPEDLAKKYAEPGCLELLYIDTVATLYGRNQLEGLLEKTAHEVFVPITVGGGIQSLADVKRLLRCGADVVAINTAAIKRPDLISEIANVCGNQAVCVSIEAKKTSGGWECYTDNGRERTGKDVVDWAAEAVQRGAGEVLVTSVDRDGTLGGLDLDLLKALGHLPVPVIAGGGVGTLEHVAEAFSLVNGVACATALHHKKFTVQEVVDGLAEGKFQAEGRGNEGRGEAGPQGRVSEESLGINRGVDGLC